MTFNGPTPSLDNSLGSTPASGPSNDQLPETPIEQSQTQSWPLSKDLDDNVPAVDTSDAAIAAFAAIDHRLPEARINQFQPQSTPLLKGSNNPVPAPDTPPAAIAASAAPNNQRPGFGTKQSQPSYGLQRTADEAESPSLDPSAYSRSVSRPLSVNERVAHHVPKSNGSSDAEPRSPLVSTPYSEFVPIYHKVLAKLTHPKTRSAAEDVLINFEKRIPLTVEECHIMYTLYHHVTDARGDELARRDICAVLGFMRGKLYYDREAEALFMKFRLSSEVQTVISTSVDSNLEWWKTCARIEYYGYLVEMGKLVRRQVLPISKHRRS